MQGKAEVMIAVTHLAFARSQKIGTGISANNRKYALRTFYCYEYKRKSSQHTDCFFFCVRRYGRNLIGGGIVRS